MEQMMGLNDRILTISDMHQPYSHPDTLRFLKALKAKYKPTRVICMGDEIDMHAMSFHDSDPDLLSAGDELRLAIKKLRPLYTLFPKMDLLDSNHGSMVYRKGKHHGIPRKVLKDYNDVLDAPKGWVWHNDLMVRLPNGNQAYFCHGISNNVMKVVAGRSLCVVQGHFHNSYSIGYLSTPQSLLWGLQVGCMIDKKGLAFAYDKLNLNRPILGHAIIINGLPVLLPMTLTKAGRWNGVVP